MQFTALDKITLTFKNKELERSYAKSQFSSILSNSLKYIVIVVCIDLLLLVMEVRRDEMPQKSLLYIQRFTKILISILMFLVRHFLPRLIYPGQYFYIAA